MKQVFSATFFLVICMFSYGQDSHYWNIQYGTKATLLGGTVIGSVTDLSATYYNPGALSLFTDQKVILSAKVYQIEKIKIQNGAGTNKDLDYTSITPAPSFVAINIKIDSTGRNKLAFSLLTRQLMNFDFESGEMSEDTDPSTYSYTTGGFSMKQDFKEIWTGVSYSHKLNRMLSLGATAYIAYRDQTTDFQTVIEAFQIDQQIASLLAYRKLKFINYRTLLKAGLAVNLKPITLGLTITTPSIDISGSGSYGYHNFVNNPADAGNNIYESNLQYDLNSKYNTSWAIGLGGAYWGEKINVHLSGEWYNAVKKYQPLTLEPFYSQSSGDTLQKEINQEFNNILNAGIGIDCKLNDKICLSGSFITDFSANIENLKSNISLSKWDIYHVSAGSNFEIGKAEITLGLSFSSGGDVIHQNTDIADPGNLLSNLNQEVYVKYYRLKALFGFVF
jgi:hypothetical protein